MEVDILTSKDKKELNKPPDYYSKGKRGSIVRLAKDHPYYHTSNKGNVSEARLTMAIHLGRNLTNDDIVYFKDEDTTNVEVNNLIILTRREFWALQQLRKLKKQIERINSLMPIYERCLLEHGIDPITLDRELTTNRYREVDRDREAYDRSKGRRVDIDE